MLADPGSRAHQLPVGAMPAFNEQQRGFSLIEMMVSIAVGLIVVAGAMAMFGSTINNNRDMIASMRLNQDLSTVVNIMASELRRAGFGPRDNDIDEDSYIWWNDYNDSITLNIPSHNCVLFAYDQDYFADNDSDVDISDDEYRGFLFENGAIYMRERCTAGDNVTCSTSCDRSDGDWTRLLDQTTMTVTAFNINTDGSKCIHNGTKDYWLIPDGDNSTAFPCRQWVADKTDSSGLEYWEYDSASRSYSENTSPTMPTYDTSYCGDDNFSEEEKIAYENLSNAVIEVRNLNFELTVEMDTGGTTYTKDLASTVKVRNEYVEIYSSTAEGTCP